MIFGRIFGFRYISCKKPSKMQRQRPNEVITTTPKEELVPVPTRRPPFMYNQGKVTLC